MNSENECQMRVLLLGDASNYHRCLAEGLRRRGHEVTVASNGGGWLATGCDIDLHRRWGNRLGGLDLWLRIKRMLSTKLADYDVVQVIGTTFAELKPVRLNHIFDALMANNRQVFVTALGTDTAYLDTCLRGELRYSEWLVGHKPTPYHQANHALIDAWHSDELERLGQKMYHHSGGTMTALYEYHISCGHVVDAERLHYAGIPIDTGSLPYRPFDAGANRPMRLMIGIDPARMAEKGTDRLLAAAKKVVERYPDLCTLDIAERLPYNEFISRIAEADVVLDQIYSYTPATTALLAMAMGKVAVSGGEPEYYDFIGEHELRPVVNAIPDDASLESTIERLVTDRRALSMAGERSHEFVMRHNDVDVVARRFENAWRGTGKLSTNKSGTNR